jgi:microcystin-dependent protein
MSNPYVGEIRMFGGNFAPQGWMFCDGSILAIAQNEVLFQLIGTTYGGDGQTSFALPDLRGRAPLHQGTGPGLSTRVIGEQGGSETVTVTTSQMPQHTHTLKASSGLSTGAAGAGGVLAASSVNIYGSGPPTTPMAVQGISAQGGAQPHENMAPYLAISYIISLFGIFPSQS